MPHVHFDRHRERDLYAVILDGLPPLIGHSSHVDEQVVGSESDIVVDTTGALREVVENRADAERRKDVRCDLEAELTADRPSLGVGRLAEIDFAAHDHRDELIRR